MKKKVTLSITIVLLLVMITAMCVACVPKADKLQKKLQKKGYEVSISNTSEMFDAERDAQKVLIASKKGSASVLPELTVVWFKDKKTAEKAYKTIKKEIKDWGDPSKGYKVEQKGNTVIYGIKAAIKLV